MTITPEKKNFVIKDWEQRQAYIFDPFGISYEDKVMIPMASGKKYLMEIGEIKPITEARFDGKHKESGWFLITLKNEKEVNQNGRTSME